MIQFVVILGITTSVLTINAASPGTVIAWGNNGEGQTNVPANLSNATAVAAGDNHTVALKNDGTVVAWGQNGAAQTDVPGSLNGVRAIAAGWVHTVALKSNGTVVSWRGLHSVPAGLNSVVAIASGHEHIVALRNNGRVVAWGDSFHGQTNVPASLTSVRAIAAGGDHTVALRSNGTVVAWGYNFYGQATVPSGLSGVTAIAAGWYHTLALKGDGTVVAWGRNLDGQRTVPAGLSGVTAIAAGYGHSVALKNDGKVVAWGSATVPADLIGVTAIAAGQYHTVAITIAPIIITQPVSRSVIAGQSASLSVVAKGPPSLSYQWRKDGTNINGATGAVYLLTNAQPHHAGSYVVVVSNGALSVTSAPPALLTVQRPPMITAQPMSQRLNEGQNTSLRVVATGDALLTYQWRKDGTNIEGATNATYSLTGVQTNQAGNYTVVVGNSAGSVTSSPPATITVNAALPGVVAVWGDDSYGQATVPAGVVAVTRVAAGFSHTVALKSNGTVVAWGDNTDGQTTVPPDLIGVVAVAAGTLHTVALKNDGTVVAWGDNTYNQTNAPPGLSGVIAISAGFLHTVALKNDGTVVAWGDNFDRQINIPAGLIGVTAIAAGGSHSVALKNNGTVVAWGHNFSGQTNVPLGLIGVKAIAAGSEHSVALKNDGTVVVWGDEFTGITNVPPGLSSVAAIDAGSYYTLALKNDGTVVAWGGIFYNPLFQAVPAGLAGVTAIAAGGNHSAVITTFPFITSLPTKQTVNAGQNATFRVTAVGNSPLSYQWRHAGTNISGATNATYTKADVQNPDAGAYTVVVSNGAGAVTSAPPALLTLNPVSPGGVIAWGANQNGQTTVPAQNAVTAIAAGYSHTVALKVNGTIVVWGDNAYGQRTVPAGLGIVTAIAAGGFHNVVLRSDETVLAWGNNLNSQTDVPPDLGDVKKIAAGGYHTVALKSTGKVVAWGDNAYGQTNVPASLNAVMAIAAGGYHTVALKSNGTVVAWGDNTSEQRTVPTGLNGVAAIAAGFYHTVVLRSNGTVVAWGDNGSGQRTVPAGLSGVIAIAAGDGHTVALRSDGTLVAWGANGSGQTTAPVGLSGVTAIAAGAFHTVALAGIGPLTPLAIAAQPLSRVVIAGKDVSFAVTASGIGPFTYQWRKEGIDISVATNAAYALTNVQTNHSGSYRVVVKNDSGSVTSRVASLTVLSAPPATSPSLAASVASSNSTEFGFHSDKNRHYTLEASTDLQVWQPTDLFLQGNGNALTIARDRGLHHEFFRLAVVPRLPTIAALPPAGRQPLFAAVSDGENALFVTTRAREYFGGRHVDSIEDVFLFLGEEGLQIHYAGDGRLEWMQLAGNPRWDLIYEGTNLMDVVEGPEAGIAWRDSSTVTRAKAVNTSSGDCSTFLKVEHFYDKTSFEDDESPLGSALGEFHEFLTDNFARLNCHLDRVITIGIRNPLLHGIQKLQEAKEKLSSWLECGRGDRETCIDNSLEIAQEKLLEKVGLDDLDLEPLTIESIRERRDWLVRQYPRMSQSTVRFGNGQRGRWSARVFWLRPPEYTDDEAWQIAAQEIRRVFEESNQTAVTVEIRNDAFVVNWHRIGTTDFAATKSMLEQLYPPPFWILIGPHLEPE